MTLVRCLLILAFLSVPARADVKLPQASGAASIARSIGITDIRIDYHSPGVKKRKIFGGLVPMGEVWRLGANDATVIHLSTAVTMGGHNLPAGSYALFAIPNDKSWTLIVNRDWQQWGAYFYKPENDVFRVDVPVQRGDFAEWMRFDLEPVDPTTLRATFAWDRTHWGVDITVDVNRLVWAELDSAMAVESPERWSAYHQAARFSLDTNERNDESLAWIDQSMVLKESFWNYELKARLLHRGGRTEEALPLLDTAMRLAEGKAPAEYVNGLAKTHQEWTLPGK